MPRFHWPRVTGDIGASVSLLRHAAVRLHLLVCAASATLLPSPAFAGAAPVHVYTVAAGSLSNALDAFAAQGDIQLVYDPALVAGKITHGVAGPLAPADALRQLLAGTGLGWKMVGATTFVLTSAHARRPADRTAPAAAPQPRTLNVITVSGSLIGNANIQTATPTYTVSAADMRARGFNSLPDVLQNLVLATDSVQGPQAARSFTQGAQPVSWFGLGPQFTLILIDGKPVANFGRLYNGSISFTNVANLPMGLIDHIDVMPGGASSIYGSQAIGGVVNIVTRSQFEGAEISVRDGRFTGGGGANQRISGVYGRSWGAWHVLAALEFDNASPIWGYQRPLTTHDIPAPAVQADILDYGNPSTYNGYAQGHLSPPQGCARQLFGGSTLPVSNPQLPGTYCGSRNVDSYTTYSNQLRNIDGMWKLQYRFSDDLRLYSDALVDWQQQRWYPGVSAWHQWIEDASSLHYLYLERIFAPEEMPGAAAGQMYRQNDLLYQADIGANGQWGDSGWNWDVYYLRTGDRTTVAEPLWIRTKINRFFQGMLGPVRGVEPQFGLNMYEPNYPAFFAPITPQQYAGFTRQVHEFSDSWINNTRATLSNAALFPLPGGDAGVAALVEGGSETWLEPVNPLFLQRKIFEHASTSGGGERRHAAAAFEWNLPLLKVLTLDLSGRYDYYALDRGGSNHKLTYKAGVEYRPAETLLLRGNYTTSFKAPDLSSIYLGPTTDFYVPVKDYYLCALAQSTACGTDYQHEIPGVTLPNRKLQPTSAHSWDVGAVWSPAQGLDLSLDYLRIAIRNEVVEQDTDVLSRTDAQCLLGQLPAASALCMAALSQVQRAGNQGPITGVTTYYENLANEVTKSVIGSARYRFALFHLGMLSLEFDYNDMLHHSYQEAPGLASINLLARPQSSTEFKSILSGSLTWTSPRARWGATLYGHRYGPSPNYLAFSNGVGYPGAARVSPWITVNASATYHPTAALSLSLLVNNMANKMPPRDQANVQYPYFNNDNYNIYGREIMLQADLRLGR
jgi:outer membrane receptor protein involved in Fe transport